LYNGDNNTTLNICMAHNVSHHTELDAPAVARWAPLVRYVWNRWKGEFL